MTNTTAFESMPLGSSVTPVFGSYRGVVGEVSIHNYADNTIEVYFPETMSTIVSHVEGLVPA